MASNARELPATAAQPQTGEHQAIVKRQSNPHASIKYPERKAIKLTTEKWRRFIDFIANSGYPLAEALKAADVARDTYNVFVLTDQAKRDEVADARITWSRRYWTEEILDTIFLAIANGMPGRHAIEEHASPLIEGDPVISFYALIRADVEIASSFKASRMIAMENMADEIIEISDDANNDVLFITDKKGEQQEVSNPSAVRRAEVKIRARQWLMSKLHSDQFGDKPLVTVEQNIQVNHVAVLDAARKRTEGADERRKRMLADPTVVADQ